MLHPYVPYTQQVIVIQNGIIFMVKISKQAKIDHLHSFIEFVTSNAIKCGLSQKRITEIELVTEEAVINIINYAYEDITGDIEITCKKDNESHFIIEIVDEGQYFDVLSKEEPDLTSDIEERAIGGLGVFFMKQFIDEIKYRREGDKNRLTLVVQQN